MNTAHIITTTFTSVDFVNAFGAAVNFGNGNRHSDEQYSLEAEIPSHIKKLTFLGPCYGI